MEGPTTTALLGICIAFNLLSCVSQYYRIWTLTRFDGLSWIYVLINMLAASEHLMLGLWRAIELDVNDPTTWESAFVLLIALFYGTSMGQFTVAFQWNQLVTSPAHAKQRYRIAERMILLLTWFPLVLEFGLWRFVDDDTGLLRSRLLDPFMYLHFRLLQPGLTAAQVVAVIVKLQELQRCNDRGLLDPLFLLVQALTSTLIGFLWYFQTAHTDPELGLIDWYQRSGWASAHWVVYGVCHSVLFIASMRKHQRRVLESPGKDKNGETV